MEVLIKKYKEELEILISIIKKKNKAKDIIGVAYHEGRRDCTYEIIAELEKVCNE